MLVTKKQREGEMIKIYIRISNLPHGFDRLAAFAAVHTVPSPEKPSLHKQVKLPRVLVQNASR